MFEYNHLKKLIQFLINREPKSNIYIDWLNMLHYLEEKSNELRNKINEEVKRYRQN
ncbi:MAG: hypothetical protein ACFE9S_17470 [Candidatus Hermodarchaeota archaeon]